MNVRSEVRWLEFLQAEYWCQFRIPTFYEAMIQHPVDVHIGSSGQYRHEVYQMKDHVHWHPNQPLNQIFTLQVSYLIFLLQIVNKLILDCGTLDICTF